MNPARQTAHTPRHDRDASMASRVAAFTLLLVLAVGMALVLFLWLEATVSGFRPLVLGAVAVGLVTAWPARGQGSTRPRRIA
jgi:hypothetical protein